MAINVILNEILTKSYFSLINSFVSIDKVWRRNYNGVVNEGRVKTLPLCITDY